MKVLILDDNLMWSARLARGIRSLGHEAESLSAIPSDGMAAALAILNLGHPRMNATAIPALRQMGLKVIAHAGHKEKDLLNAGRAAGADLVVTNSELTNKLEKLLEQALLPGLPGSGTP